MALPIADYALIGNMRTAALVGRDGSIDWLCMPRFDSGACFAALLGASRHGRWRIAPAARVRRVRRAYREGTLVLETDFETEGGRVRVCDCMPIWEDRADVVRIVTGLEGRVDMRLELVIRFDYGSVVPWVTRIAGGVSAIAGPDTLRLYTTVPLRGEDFSTLGEFSVGQGETVSFTLGWHHSSAPAPAPLDAYAACEATSAWWRDWVGRAQYEGDWPQMVQRSLITLKALSHAPTGGTIAAPTASLPEQPGGTRNWDYRYCWLRDATFTLYALLVAGYEEEARAWREWLLRAAAGRPQDLQILYGVAGERRLDERALGWLPGYGEACPVRIGNAAAEQHQLDVYGEVMDALHLCRRSGLQPNEHAWALQTALLEFLEGNWREPDNGIWEVRGEPKHFTHSKVMAWVAFDRGVKAIERFELDGPLERWRALREQVHGEVHARGYSASKRAFVQHFGGETLDASLLMMPLVGFIAPDDARMRSTVDAIGRELMREGFVHRYDTAAGVDGLPPGEGVFLPCTFWLVDNLAMTGQRAQARELFERLIGVANDVGLLSEEYDPETRRLLGNFPQALSHVALLNSAYNLAQGTRPGEHRANDDADSQDAPSGTIAY